MGSPMSLSMGLGGAMSGTKRPQAGGVALLKQALERERERE
jgi:hypothetical protein